VHIIRKFFQNYYLLTIFCNLPSISSRGTTAYPAVPGNTN